jgi:DNA-binding IclR family transcriptional regulator
MGPNETQSGGRATGGATAAGKSLIAWRSAAQRISAALSYVPATPGNALAEVLR